MRKDVHNAEPITYKYEEEPPKSFSKYTPEKITQVYAWK